MSISRVPGIVHLLPFLVLAGCASGTGAAATGPGTRENVRSTEVGMSVEVFREPGRAQQAIPAPADRVWPHLAEVYAELGIPVTATDPAARTVVASGQRLRSVGGRGIAAFFDCGGGFGNAAAQYQVLVTARTQVDEGEDGGSVARTAVEAVARAPASGTRVVCRSTGQLEHTIGQRLLARSLAAG